MQRQLWRNLGWGIGGVLGLALPAIAVALVPQNDAWEKEYLAATLQDPVARLQKDIDSGKVKLSWESDHGYLRSLLSALKISPTSQSLVFSKTSFQRNRISRTAPRAIYFNDDVYIGSVLGSDILEISSVDPIWGGAFYTLHQTPSAKPRLERQTYDCLQCHNTTMTGNIPGHIVRSVYAQFDGEADFRQGSHITTDESPWEERWGGWYVTGKHGAMRHLGNETIRGGENYSEFNKEVGANVTDLRRYFDTSMYLTPHSDILALMVLAHQVHVHNLIAQTHYQVKAALRDEQVFNEALKRPADYRSESTISRIQNSCDTLLQAMLFAKETPLTGPITGTAGFGGKFAAQGPKDSKGRSLRQFNLKTRLFMYPCSYLIYSEAFDALPADGKEMFYARLWEVLNSREKGMEYSRLTVSDRQAIREILLETKPDFAAWVAKHGKENGT